MSSMVCFPPVLTLSVIPSGTSDPVSMAEPEPKSALDPPQEILAELGEESDEYDDIEVRLAVLAGISALSARTVPWVYRIGGTLAYIRQLQEEVEHEEGGYEDEDEEEDEGDEEAAGGSVRFPCHLHRDAVSHIPWCHAEPDSDADQHGKLPFGTSITPFR